MNYFNKGYHDIGSVLLMVSNERLAFAMLEKLSLYHIRYPLVYIYIYNYKLFVYFDLT